MRKIYNFDETVFFQKIQEIDKKIFFELENKLKTATEKIKQDLRE